MKLIDKDAFVAEIERRRDAALTRQKNLESIGQETVLNEMVANELNRIISFLDTLEVKEVDLYNNGWIDCTKRMPPETKQTSDTLQGHREWTKSDMVLVWDSMYGCSVDVTKNGKWMSEQRGSYTGQLVHGIIAWRPIPKFSEELLLKAQKGE